MGGTAAGEMLPCAGVEIGGGTAGVGLASGGVGSGPVGRGDPALGGVGNGRVERVPLPGGGGSPGATGEGDGADGGPPGSVESGALRMICTTFDGSSGIWIVPTAPRCLSHPPAGPLVNSPSTAVVVP